MSDRQYDMLIKSIIEHYDVIELEILKNIGKRLMFDETITPTIDWLFGKLGELGGLTEDNLKIIAKYSNMTNKELKYILETVGIDSLPMTDLTKAYTRGDITINPMVFASSPAINNIINQSYLQASNTFLQINRSIVESAREQYVDILNQAYLEVSAGVYSYQDSIRRGINKMGEQGISAATYRYVNESTGIVSTKRYDIAGVVRRDVLTSAHQLSVKTNVAVINELNPEYVKLSEHAKCRESHFPWQGTIIKRKDLVSVTDLGAVDGLGGINCKHEVYAYFGDNRGDDEKQIPKGESTKEYDLSQQQRQLERNVRRWKRKETLFETNGDTKAYNISKAKRRYWQSQTKAFVDKHNLVRDYLREKI